MGFNKEEKVFSLARATAALPRGDVKALFEELFCYLLVAGLYREGECVKGVREATTRISHEGFYLPAGAYASGINTLIAKGLKDRYEALVANQWISALERDTLVLIDSLFTDRPANYGRLTGRAFLSIAIARGFSDDMTAIARYVAVMFGQSDYPAARRLPRLYLSVFGNIHLAKATGGEVEPLCSVTQPTVMLDVPTLRYGSISPQGDMVTALWSLLSAQIYGFTLVDHPGDFLGDTLTDLMFLGGTEEYQATVPAPRFASSLYMQRIVGTDSFNPVAASVLFYKNFLYGSLEVESVSRKSLLDIVINLMMEKMGETHLDHLFSSNSYYRKLKNSSITRKHNPKRPAFLQFALEALDADLDAKPSGEEQGDDLAIADEEDPFGDPQTDDGGFDPSTPPPAQPNMDKNTIDLISFDKAGEGVNEDLYRAAVVALNDRLRSDDTLPVSTEIRDALDYWVNGFLYRTSISATQDQIKSLRLQKYLKAVSTKG